ncbi:unnamed protein product [Amoebophrya sp. A25]|nr:unnamed protein product [Amoebophrya sp. A25]|eukprot:GSA25T00018259001.1
MASLLDAYENPASAERYYHVYEKTKLLQATTEQSLKSVLKNANQMHALEIRSREMEDASQFLEASAARLKKHYWWKNKLLMSTIGIVALIILLIVVIKVLPSSGENPPAVPPPGGGTNGGDNGGNIPLMPSTAENPAGGEDPAMAGTRELDQVVLGREIEVGGDVQHLHTTGGTAAPRSGGSPRGSSLLHQPQHHPLPQEDLHFYTSRTSS